MNIPFSNFKTFREGQEDIITQVLSSDAKYNIISAPTGVGKTIIGMMLSSHRQPSVYTVSTKMLQDQILADFPEAVILKGRSNYPCPRFEEFEVMADSCIKKGCEFIFDRTLDYYNSWYTWSGKCWKINSSNDFGVR